MLLEITEIMAKYFPPVIQNYPKGNLELRLF